ncbi:single-stranded DNA-binding protein [Bacteroides sp.]|uniref:single-stranded DNA-binding protein n=1 Tax=Bacteroides sp. TaxID=29523 RepID=UPI002606AD2C|nr:single-stranded DNA-binding protein [Bacteroides sp.]MDD3038869.1 single-stranded DNA-binding protein [Bacteroides sp.]
MSVNKVILIGHVGKDPDVRSLANGAKVASFPFATTDKAYTLQNGTQVPERTEWHNIIVWNRTAEVAEKYIHKGDKLFLEGKIRTRSYDDKNGVKHFITEVFVDFMEMLTPKPQQTAASMPPPTQQPMQNNLSNRQQESQQVPSYQTPPPPVDDLPF